MSAEPEVRFAQRAWLDAQAGMESSGVKLEGHFTATWRDSPLERERGALAVVRSGGPLDEYVGDTIRIRLAHSLLTRHDAAILYVVGSSDISSDLAITRRAAAALDFLSVEELSVQVEVLD